MRIPTRKLTVGDVMYTGEIVVKAKRSGALRYGSPKLYVVLVNPKNNKRREAWWSYFGTLSVRTAQAAVV